MGLMLALQLDSFEQVREVQLKCLDKGLILDWFLFNDSSIRLSPPLTITESEIGWAAEVVKGVL
jgi:acetylornithine/N-succinyldiaminopimelate aminotransferase